MCMPRSSASPTATSLQTKLSAAAVLAAFVVLCVVNYLVTSGKGVRFSNTDIAHTHPVYALPVGWAFSIWGIIYLLEGAFVIYQALPFGGLNDERLELLRPRVLCIFACNVAWLFLFGHEQYWVAAVVIVLYDYLLFRLLELLDVDYFSSEATLPTKLLTSAGFSANASWVTVASLLQLQVNLLEEGWMPSPALTAGELVVAVAVACAAVYKYSDVPYALVAGWALGGIAVNQQESSKWGCASQVCPACAPGMDICERNDTSAIVGRPNGFANLCAGWNASAEDECFVAKSAEVTGWAVAGIIAVLLALSAGLVRGACAARSTKQALDDAVQTKAAMLTDAPAHNSNIHNSNVSSSDL